MMLGRNVWFIVILVAAVAVPYNLSSDPLSGDSNLSSIKNWWHSLTSNGTAQGNGYDPNQASWPGQSNYGQLNYSQSRFDGTRSGLPTATASPLPPNYSRRPIQSVRSPVGSEVPFDQNVTATYGNQASMPSSSTVGLVPVATTGTAAVADNGARPPFHDWMPVNNGMPVNNAGGFASRGITDVTSTGEMAIAQTPPSLCGPNAPCFSQLVNFDITPAWVMNNWQRVSTRLAEFDLEGLRVPVVTGTEVDDLVGTMTYYFDRRQTLQRISFDGYTGEPTPLVNVMTNQFGLQAEPWLGAGFYVRRDQAKQMSSVMRIMHASIIRASEARQRYNVELELNRPDSELRLSQRYRSLIESDQESNALAKVVDANTIENGVDDALQKTADQLETDAMIRKLESEANAGLPNASVPTESAQKPVAESTLSEPSAQPAQGMQAPPAYADPFLAPSQNLRPQTLQPQNASLADGPISQPKPLNGSAEPVGNIPSGGIFNSGGLFGRFGRKAERATAGGLDVSGLPSGGSRLYPSQLPSNWQRNVPPPR